MVLAQDLYCALHDVYLMDLLRIGYLHESSMSTFSLTSPGQLSISTLSYLELHSCTTCQECLLIKCCLRTLGLNSLRSQFLGHLQHSCFKKAKMICFGYRVPSYIKVFSGNPFTSMRISVTFIYFIEDCIAILFRSRLPSTGFQVSKFSFEHELWALQNK